MTRIGIESTTGSNLEAARRALKPEPPPPAEPLRDAELAVGGLVLACREAAVICEALANFLDALSISDAATGFRRSARRYRDLAIRARGER